MTPLDLVDPLLAEPDLSDVEGVKPGRKRDHTRDPEILDAALEVLAETGYDGMTVDMVATRARQPPAKHQPQSCASPLRPQRLLGFSGICIQS